MDPHQTFALEKKIVSFDNKENAETFKNVYENLASDLVDKLPLPTDKFNKEKIKDYYKHLNIENNNFTLKPTTYKNVLSLMEKINPNKAVGIDNLSGRFLRDGAKAWSP